MTILYRSIILVISFLLISACGDSSSQQSQQAKSSEPTPAKVETASAVPAQEVAAEKCSLTMGWEPWEPYHYEDQEQKVKGLDIEMLTMISKEMGCDITFQKGEWKELLHAVKTGSVDLLTGASVTESRREFAHFSDGYRTEKFSLFVRNGESDKYQQTNLTSMVKEGFRLGITMDYIYNHEVDELQDDPELNKNVYPVSVGMINFSRLLDNQIDGFLEDPVVGASAIRRQGLENKIELHPYAINTGDVHIMFSKSTITRERVNEFNMALDKIRKDGRHKRLMDKYTN